MTTVSPYWGCSGVNICTPVRLSTTHTLNNTLQLPFPATAAFEYWDLRVRRKYRGEQGDISTSNTGQSYEIKTLGKKTVKREKTKQTWISLQKLWNEEKQTKNRFSNTVTQCPTRKYMLKKKSIRMTGFSFYQCAVTDTWLMQWALLFTLDLYIRKTLGSYNSVLLSCYACCS